MAIVGLGRRVQIFIDESDRLKGQSLYWAILEKLRAEGAAGAVVTRGIAGFGIHSRIHSARLADIASPLPIVITWIDAPQRVERLLPVICAMVREGLVTVDDVQIAHYSHRDLASLRPTLQVGEVMTADVAAVRPETPLIEVVDALIGRDFRALPVLDAGQRVVGIITNEDLVERGGLAARLELLGALKPPARWQLIAAARARTAGEVMTPSPVTVHPEDPLERVVELMLGRQLKRLPVVDHEGRLVGMVSRVDVLRALGESYPAPTGGAPAPSAAARQVEQVMQREVPLVPRQAPLAEVLDVVVSTDLNLAVVVDEGRRVLGVISDAEVLARMDPRAYSGVLGRLMGRGGLVPEEAARTTAEQMMTSPALTLAPDTPIEEAARRLLEARQKAAPVVDARGVVLGIVDRAALLAALRSGPGEG